MNNNKLELNSYEGLGQIGAMFSAYLMDVIDEHPELRVLSSDMSYIAKLERFKAYYPHQFINVGIAEQNLIGVSAGLTSEGFKCIALAQATFITMRCFDQVRQYMSYMGYPIILVGLSAGFGLQFMGNSHYAMEDMSLIKSVPGIELLSPADAGEAVKALQYALSSNKPTYIRVTGNSETPLIYKEDFEYSPNQAHILTEGEDVTIFATGATIVSALQVAELLKQAGLTTRVVDIHCLSPLDVNTIKKSKESKLLVSVEEHYTTGGLGSSISDVISETGGFPRLLKLGIQNRYSSVGDYEYLLKQHRLTPDEMVEDIIKKYNSL